MDDNWQYSTTYNSPCKAIDRQILWDQTICRIWLSDSDSVVKVPCDSLQPLKIEIDRDKELSRILYIFSAAKIAQAVENSSVRNEQQVLICCLIGDCIVLSFLG
jgi:hypothetical protein